MVPAYLLNCVEAEAILLEAIMGTSISFILVMVWFMCRHNDTWIWVLHDFLSISITCAFLLNIRIANLRLATYLLGAFFVYDVFMTFITPLLFNGESVMVEVATAGTGTEKVCSLLAPSICMLHQVAT